MSSSKSRPISLRLDENLYQVLKEKADSESKNFNVFIREKLYEMSKIENLELSTYQKIDLDIKSSQTEINNHLVGLAYSMSAILNSAKEINKEFKDLNERDDLIASSEKTINNAKRELSNFENTVSGTVQQIKKEQEQILNDLMDHQRHETQELREVMTLHASILKKESKDVYAEVIEELNADKIAFDRTKTDKKKSVISYANYALFFLLLGMSISLFLLVLI